jgi:ubiquinone/menaquinone biosynthesis C-methylase UbiE
MMNVSHKFEIKNKDKLDNEWRRENLPPFPTLEKMGLVNNDIVADIGCGIGYFTIPAAEMVKSSNKVYALDISEEMLEEVEKKAIIAALPNIISINTKEYDLVLPDEGVTFAIMVNVLHEIEDKERFVKEINRILKVKGKVAIIEWEKKQTQMGPPTEHRIAEDEVISLLNSFDIVTEKRIKFADCFYGILAVKE